MIPRHVSSFLDRARWISAALVVVTHLRLSMFPSWSSLGWAPAAWPLRLWYLASWMGFPSVVVFFVMSGFLVGGKALADFRAGAFSAKRYAINRFSRIYIVLVPTLLLVWALDGYGLGHFNGQDIYEPVVSQSHTWGTFLANLFCLEGIQGQLPLGSAPLSSLADEVWYYILFPLALAACFRRPSWRQLGLALLTGILASLLSGEILMLGLFWVLGALLSQAPKLPLPKRPILWLLLVVSGIFSHWINFHGGENRLFYLFLGGLAVSAVFSLCLLAEMQRPAPPAKPGRTDKFLADFSYSLYLTHRSLLCFCFAAIQTAMGAAFLGSLSAYQSVALCLGVLALCFAFAWAFSLLTERRTDALRRGLGRLAGHAPASR